MSDIAIKVENLSKKYIIGHGQSGSLRETICNYFGSRNTNVEINLVKWKYSFKLEFVLSRLIGLKQNIKFKQNTPSRVDFGIGAEF